MSEWPKMDQVELALWEAELRACIGIPWRHMGRQGLPYGHQTGLDCVGLLMRGAYACGRPVQDMECYEGEPDGSLYGRIVSHVGSPCAPDRGCIVLMRILREPHHVGYITMSGSLIHAYNGGSGVVVEHPFATWANRIVSAWRLT